MRTQSANRRHSLLRRWTFAVAATSLVGGLVVSPATAAVSAGSARAAQKPAVPTLDWQDCGPDAPGYQCATARVPLDYDHPRGAKISLALSRIQATDPSRRIGSLFLNPGGPGGSGVGFVQGFGKDLYSPEVRARFDLVGFDPRGVAGSNPLLCFHSQQDADAITPPFPFPVTPGDERVWIQHDRAYARACSRNAGPIINHMSTADVARDMDLLRQAVGDKKMTFAGYSYGSYLGSVYANMFPSKVRAVIIDGVIDPISDATGRGNEWKRLSVDARLVSEQGAYEELQDVLRLCDLGGQNCAFSAGNPKRRYDKLAARLRLHPVELSDGEGGTVRVTYADLVTTTLGALYNFGDADLTDLAEFLEAVDTASSAARISAARAALARATRDDPPYTQGAEGFYGVWCTDSLDPNHVSAWVHAARAADRKWPYFGRFWNWEASICAEWPGHDSDRYLGPFNKRTANPVLVIGDRFDPATRYQDAVSTAKILGRGRLLTVNGWGHTSLFRSTCGDGYASRYLLTGALPPAGTVCAPDVVPFAEPLPLAAQRTQRPTFGVRPPSR